MPILLVMNCDRKNQAEWEDPTIFQINQEPPRAHFFAYESEALAKINNPLQSEYFQSLNGTWKFNFSKNTSYTYDLGRNIYVGALCR